MALRGFLGLAPARAVTWAVIYTMRFCARCITLARSRALFPDAPDVFVHWSSEVKYPRHVTLGRRVLIGPNCTIGAKAPIYLGDDVHLSKGVLIETGTGDISTLPPYRPIAKPIRIERGVWLGAGAMVLSGVTIGEYSVIAAGTVVRKDVPAHTIVSVARPISQSLAELEREPAVEPRS